VESGALPGRSEEASAGEVRGAPCSKGGFVLPPRGAQRSLRSEKVFLEMPRRPRSSRTLWTLKL
jgi:hypothetical protein